MSEQSEVIVMSHGTGSGSSICLLDPFSGTTLRRLKHDNQIGNNCLSFVGNDYIVFAENDKPFIYSRKVNGGVDKLHFARNVKEKVSALAVSPNSQYCVFAVEANINVLSLDSGKITRTANRHFHSIKCIKFTDDGSCFVTAGLDGIIVVWNLAYILSYEVGVFLKNDFSRLREPMHVFTSHSLPITDLYVGHGGMQAFIASVSGDQTCNIHSLSDGNCILSLVFKCGLSAVTMSISESELFVATVKCNIHKCNISRMPRTRDYHMNEDDLSFMYQGHDKPISCLSTSLDGLHLLSASSGKIILWDIKSGQSVKVLFHSPPVLNAYFVICPKNAFLDSFEPSKIVNINADNGNGWTEFYRKSGFHSYNNERRLLPYCESTALQMLQNGLGGESEEVKEEDFNELRVINRRLYEFALNHLVREGVRESH